MEQILLDRILRHMNVGVSYHQVVFSEDHQPLDYIYLFVNEAFKLFTGLKGVDIIGRKVTEVIPSIGSDSFNWIKYYGELVIHDQSDSIEQYSEALGKWYRIDVSVFEGRFFMTTFSDITSDKLKALEIAKKQNVRYELAMTGSNDGFWDWDVLTNEVYFSPRWKAQLGYETSELEDKFETFTNSIDQEDLPYVQKKIEAYLSGNLKNFDIKFRMITKSGERIWIRGRGEAIRDDMGKPIRMAGSHTDITEIIEAETSLRVKDRILEAVAEAAKILMDGNGLMEKIEQSLSVIGQAAGADRAYIFRNDDEQPEPVTSQIFEWVAEGIAAQQNNMELQALPFSDFSELMDLLQSGNTVAKLTRDFGSELKEFLEKQDVQSLLVFPVFIKDSFWGFVGFDSCQVERQWTRAEQAILGTYVYTLERTIEREAMLQSLEEEIANTEAANMAKSMFLANMSHEIRTPINGLMGMLALMDYTNMTEEQKGYIHEAQNASESLLFLINDILDLSKIEAGKLVLEKIEFDVRGCIEEAVASFAQRADEKQLDLPLLIHGDVPRFAIGDPARLRQILNNLLSNGIKFTHEGFVSTEVSLLACDQRLTLSFRIQDSGIGMDAESISKVFKPFVQGDLSTTRKYGGTGLGLAITHQIIELMKGDIQMESAPDKGTSFTFTVELDGVAEDVMEQRYVYGAIAGKKVLIVDDQKLNRHILKAYLQEAGCLIHEAKSSTEALSVVLKQNLTGDAFDVIVLDYKMPDINGLEFVKMASQIEGQHNTKYILATSLPQKGDIKGVHEAGFHGYLTKPFRREDLLRVMSLVVGMRTFPSEPQKVMNTHLAKEIKGLKKLSILVVEDNPINQKVVVKTLQKEGYECDVANNGQEALKAWKRNTYDVIFMDCQMPIMDGYEATRQIRNAEREPKVKIIAMTAYAMAGDADKCYEAGMDGYISKPVDFDKVIHLLEGISSKREAVSSMMDEAKALLHSQSQLTEADINEIYNDFIKHFRGHCLEMEKALESKDFDGLSKIAHQVKGTAGNLRIKAIAESCKALEVYCEDGNIEGCQGAIKALKETI